MNHEKKLLRDTVLLGISSVISKGVTFLLMPLYTACLSPAEFGTADILISTAVLILPLVSFGAPEAVFRFIAGGAAPAAVFSAGAFSFLFGVSLFLFSLPFFSSLGLFPRLFLYFVLYVSFAAFHSFMAYMIRAEGDYMLFSLQQLFGALLTAFLQLLFLPILSLGVKGYVSAIFLSDALVGLWLAVVLLRRGRLLFAHFSKELLFSMWRYSLPLIPTAALWWCISLSDRYVLLHFYGEGMTGIYAAASKIPAILTLTVNLFLEAWRYTSLRTSEGEEYGLFSKIYGYFLAFSVFATAILILFGGGAVSFLFSHAYRDAERVLPFLLLAALFSGFSSFFSSVYARKKASYRAFITSMLGGSVNIILNFLLIPRYAVTGAALSTLIAWLVVFFVRGFDSRPILFFEQKMGKTVLSFLFLLGAAVALYAESAAGFLYATAAVLVFFREIREICLFLMRESRAFFHKNGKNLVNFIKNTKI